MFPFSKSVTTTEETIKNTLSVKTYWGINYSLGLAYQHKLGKHFSLATQLLYQYSNYRINMASKFRVSTSGFPFFQNTDTDQYLQFCESSLSIPVLLHYHFIKQEKTSIAIGLDLNRVLSRTMVQQLRVVSLDQPQRTKQESQAPRLSPFDALSGSLGLNMGIYQRIHSNTRVGVEFCLQNRMHYLFTLRQYPQAPGNIDTFFSFVDPVRESSFMKSLCLVLQHNILR